MKNNPKVKTLAEEIFELKKMLEEYDQTIRDKVLEFLRYYNV